MKRLLLFILSLFYFTVCNWAQDNTIHSQYRVRYLTVEEGLSNNKVNAICQDKYGFLWLGTNEGLNRYDGYEFRIYKHKENDSLSLTNNFVRALILDSKGVLWAGTFNGICRYNVEYDYFEKIYFAPDEFEEEKYAWHLYEDNRGTVWISATDGLYYVEQGSNEGKRFEKIEELKVQVHVTEVYQDSRGNILIGTLPLGLFIYNLNTGEYQNFRYNELDSNTISQDWIESIYEDDKGNLWIGTNDAGLNIFHYEDTSFTRFIIDKNDYYSNRIRDILQDRQGRLWMGTRNGLYIKKENANTFIHYAHSKHEYSILSNSSIYDVYIDNNDIMWIGTYAGGVNYIDFNQKKFIHFYAKPNDNRFLNNSIVYSIFEDENQDIYVGTERGGLNYFDRSKGTFQYFTHDPDDPTSIGANNVKAIIQDKKGNLWVGTYEGGLNYFNTKTKTFKRYIVDPDIPSRISQNRVYSLLLDSKENLWVGLGSGIDILPKGSDEFIHLREIPGSGEFLEDNIILCIFEDSHKDIWIGSYNYGLHLFNKKDSTLVSKYEKLSDNIIYTICEDSKGKLWVGGTEGLFCINRENDSIIHYTENDGLPINTVYQVLDDKEGNLWISTSSGLSTFINGVHDPYTPNFRNYDVYDGLQSKSFINNSYNRSFSGAMYFGGINGFNVFYPEEIKDNPKPPKVVITGLKIFNDEVEVGEEVKGRIVLDKSISETKKIILSHKHKVFTIEFAALHYSQPQKNTYEYMLDGFDKEWTETGADKRFASYTNLSGGEYTFKVKACSSDGKCTEKPVELEIKILPPFYKTWLFIIIVFLIVVTSAVSFYLIRVRNLKKQRDILEIKVEERTKDLKNANSQLQNQKKTIEKSYENIKLLSEIGQKLTASLNINEINNMVFEYMISLMDITIFGIGIYNESSKSIDFPAMLENGLPVPDFSCTITDRNCAAVRCYLDNKAIFSNDFRNDYPQYISEQNIRTSKTPEAVIFIPLLVKGKKIGVVTVQSYKKNAYTKNDFTILQALALYIAIALNNANLYKLMEENNKQLERQSIILSENNTLLEERQQQIEEQTEELKVQKEELEHSQERIVNQAKKLEEANTHLRELNSTKDKFFSIIAHDLRNPFQSILGFSELLLKRYDSLNEMKKKKYANSIHGSSKAVFKLLGNLLDWARIQTGTIKFHPTDFKIDEMIKDNLSLIKEGSTEKSIELQYDCDSNLSVHADYDMINTVVRNLLSNAIKFTSSGGKIHVFCEPKGDFINLGISDTGIGISAIDMDKLFRVDATITKKGTEGEIGTGLGLILCKEFVEKNKGEIWVESKPGKGSTFSFSIPASQ